MRRSNVAVTERLPALRTAEYFLEGSGSASAAKAKRALRYPGMGEPPLAGDEVEVKAW